MTARRSTKSNAFSALTKTKRTSILCALIFATITGSAQKQPDKLEPTFFYLTPYKTRNNGSFSKYLTIISASYGLPTIFKTSEPHLGYSFFHSKHTGVGPVNIQIEF